MSDTSIPAPSDQHKPPRLLMKCAPGEGQADPAAIEKLARDTLDFLTRPEPWAHVAPPKPAPDPSTYSPVDLTLYSIRAFGFTHPSNGRFLMVPKEFQAILLRETKAVAAVVWEVLQQTIGWEDGPGKRREWAPLSVRYFERAKILSHTHARKGIADALKKGYLERRLRGARRYEYRLRWKGTN